MRLSDKSIKLLMDCGSKGDTYDDIIKKVCTSYQENQSRIKPNVKWLAGLSKENIEAISDRERYKVEIDLRYVFPSDRDIRALIEYLLQCPTFEGNYHNGYRIINTVLREEDYEGVVYEKTILSFAGGEKLPSE